MGPMWYTYGDPIIGPLVHGMGLGILFPVLFVAMMVWSFAWKAIGLWHAGRNGQRWWFVALLLTSTFGILEIVYLKWFAHDMGSGRDHVFPFLKEVKREVKARMASSAPVTKAE